MIIPIRSQEHWHELRSRNVGASEVAALFGCQPDYAMSHYTLWHVKAGRMDPPEINGERPKWGLRLEKVIAEAWGERNGVHDLLINRCPYVSHPTVRGMGCTPDFLIGDDGLLECKNVDWLIHKRQWGGEPPLNILLQAQHQMACTGREWCEIVALVGGNDLRQFRIDARPKLITEIELRVSDFWASIDAGIEPPIDGSKSTYAAVKETHRSAGDNSAIEIDDIEFSELCSRRQDAKATIKESDATVRECEAKILKMLSGAQRGYGLGWSASIIERKATPERVITETDVGKTLPGRKGSISLQVREMTQC